MAPEPSSKRARAGAAFLLVSFLAAGASSALAGIAEADSAFDAGDHERALFLYDECLREDPLNLHALVRSARLLSWQKKFEEALARYDRALSVAPSDRSIELERARVLSWAHRFSEAEAAFRKLLQGDPEDREARLGLARTLSWSGRQPEARSEYETLLARRPADPEALVGVGQTYAWSGEPTRARDYYEKALAAEPGMKEARLGLAYLDLSAGDRRSAASRAEQLARDFPRDPEVNDLLAEIHEASRPQVRVSYDRLEDTDDNVLDVFRAEAGLGISEPLDLRLVAVRYDMKSPGESAAVDSLFGTVAWAVRSNRIELRAGADRLSPPGANATTHGIGGLSWLWRTGGTWRGAVSLQQDTFRYNPEILSHRIRIRSYTVEASVRPARAVRVAGSLSAWELSDGNERTSAELGVSCPVPAGSFRVEPGYLFRYVDYRKNLPNGYFDPADFRAHLAQVSVAGPFGKTRASFDLLAEAGLQSFTRTDDLTAVTAEVRNDRVLGATATARIPLARGLAIEFYGSRTDFAVTSATGFRLRQLGFRFRWGSGR
jgi:tetratricopeptide (TPR) repeat protein